MVRRTARALLLSIGLLVLLPAIALAHPLGNFTVNHFAGIRVEPDRIVLDVVIDEAEIPTFQARLSIDTNGDGVISDAEAEVERLAACPRLVPDLDLTAAGSRLSLVEFGAGLSFPPGTAGLSTMRLVCEFTAGLPGPLAANTAIGFDDSSSPGRIGWHEVVVTSSGVSLALGHLPTTSVSNRLRLYPPKLIPHPLAINNVTFQASPGGPVTPYVEPGDALPLVTPATSTPAAPPEASDGPVASGGGAQPSTGPDAAVGALSAAGGSDPGSGTGAVPGGVVGVDIAGLIGSSAITPLVLVTSLLAALMLGAGHALTPGHGKTLMGAYLVGSRGTALHAVALGLAVTVSHTLGIILLAAVILQVRDVAPELFNTVAPVVSGLTVLAIGAWLLLGQARAYRARRAGLAAGEHGHSHGGRPGQAHTHPGADGLDQQHSHEGFVPPDAPIGWRSLFVLGLAGGLIPSTNALIILLAAINVDRPAYGLVLVIAFGLGMAIVLGGVGLALVFTRDRIDRLPSASSLGRLGPLIPVGAACLIFALGMWLTSQAILTGPAY
jgi:nickel/cobalt transporter (NicO) family protein